MTTVPIQFVPVRDVARRPAVIFSVATVPRGASVNVTGSSAGGWVFCGLGEFGEGEFLSVAGGTATQQGDSWSGDSVEVMFLVTHDGVSDEIVVTFNTRAD